ncbi:glycosyltransferase family 39 protein [Pseudomonas atagonensis]|uniref:glycosyltransferase family 39 protein n=1 Tax=Pseudomonas atagonensis TaxID=2609964 RepID=UPI00140D974C|nr:glycosyltransferase family 39 protein [Pseudomonas atagonensis]
MKSFANVAAIAGLPSLGIERLVLMAVVSLALIVRFYAIDVPSIWYDEAYSLLLARETPARIWALTALDVHPPLYYVLLHYWVMVWGDGPLPARAMSALADVGTLLLSIKLMSLMATRRATWIAALLLALLPISVRYSQEARMYALLGFWLMGATLALVCWAGKPEQTRFAALYVLLMTTAFYTHYFAGLCVLVHWLFWWQSAVQRNATRIAGEQWLVANVAIVFLYLPWIPHLLSQLALTEGLGWIEPVTLQGAMTLVWQFTVMGDGISQPSLWHLMPLALVVLCAATAIINNEGEQRFRILLVSYFFIPLVVVFLISLFLPLFVPRYLVFTAPALAMITALALDIWWTRRFLLVSAALLLLIFAQLRGLSAVYWQTDGLNGTERRRDVQFSQLMAQLNQKVRSGDEIVVANPFWYPTFAYFNVTGIVPRFEIRSSMDGFLKLTRRGALSLIQDPVTNTYFDGVTILDCRSQRIWWITDADLQADRPLFAKGRTPSFTIHGTVISAYMFAPDPLSTSIEGSTQRGLTPPPHPAAQNCPPVPSATSENRTRHSLRR